MADEPTQGNAQPATPEAPEAPAPTRQAAQQTQTTHIFQAGTNALSQPTPGVTGDLTGQDEQPVKTFTQADIDRILKDRLAQQAKQYADYDTLKAKVQTAEDAAKTEAEKMADRLKELETQNQQLAQARRELTIRSAIGEAASKAGLPADATFKLVDQTQIVVNEAGQVENAEVLVKGVAEAYPGLVRATMPRMAAANPGRSSEPAGRSDADRFRDYFQGGGGGFWSGGGMRVSDSQ